MVLKHQEEPKATGERPDRKVMSCKARLRLLSEQGKRVHARGAGFQETAWEPESGRLSDSPMSGPALPLRTRVRL